MGLYYMNYKKENNAGVRWTIFLFYLITLLNVMNFYSQVFQSFILTYVFLYNYWKIILIAGLDKECLSKSASSCPWPSVHNKPYIAVILSAQLSPGTWQYSRYFSNCFLGIWQLCRTVSSHENF